MGRPNRSCDKETMLLSKALHVDRESEKIVTVVVHTDQYFSIPM